MVPSVVWDQAPLPPAVMTTSVMVVDEQVGDRVGRVGEDVEFVVRGEDRADVGEQVTQCRRRLRAGPQSPAVVHVQRNLNPSSRSSLYCGLRRRASRIREGRGDPGDVEKAWR